MSEPNIITIYSRNGDVLHKVGAVDRRDAILKLVASRADLRGSNLSGSDLSDSNLSGATGFHPLRVTPLLMLLDQPGKIRAYKMTAADGRSPIHPNGQITYSVGSMHEVDNANPDVSESCGAGINVATLDWVMREWRPSYRVFVVEFTAADIAAIPTATDGKFRLHRCTVVAEKNLAEIGLGEKGEVAS